MRNRVLLSALASVAMTALGSVAANGQVLYSDTFNSAATAGNYNVYQSVNATGGNTSTAVFGFDYNSTLGIPAAPTNGLTDTGMTALRVQADDTTATAAATIIGAISVVTKAGDFTLPTAYKVSVEVWGNYVGGTTIGDSGGTNSTTGPTLGIGSAGTSYDGAITNAAQGGVVVEALRDPSTSGGTYRLYANGTNYGNTNGTYSIYAASGGSNAATTAQMYTNAYYAPLFPSVTAPTAQSTAATTQTGSTPAGVFGFAWHNETITQDGTNVTWTIDGNTIATLPDSSVTTFGGSQIALGDQDGNTGTGPTAYNFDLFENLVISAVPEPTTLSLVGLGAMSLLARRRK